MEPQSARTFPQEPTLYERNRLLIKGLLIGFLILLMLIPANLIMQLVKERAARQQQVISEVSSKWGQSQTLAGPYIIVPYTIVTDSVNGKARTIRKEAHFLPDVLDIKGDMQPEVRGRSTYDVILYRATLAVTGRFNPLPVADLGIRPDQVAWNEARLVFNLSDASGLQDDVSLRLNESGAALTLQSANTETGGMPANTLSVPIQLNPGAANTFSMAVKLRGSQDLSFAPMGRSTTATITSPWKSPSSIGSYLPNTSTPYSNGFTANWHILQASRPYPQAWKDGTPDFRSHTFGTRLIQPADSYAKTERSVKYAILFIALTFIVFFFIELLQRRQVHPLQYLLVGFALCVFYTLLLSISEYTGFDLAYLIAAICTVALIGLYVQSIFHSGKTALGFTSALSTLYGYIYIIIRLEDTALLAGSIGLFIILAIIMYFSRKIDWYNPGRQKTIAGA